MKLTLVRDIHAPDFTLGKLFWDTHLFYYSCEDTVRPVKIAHKTAIPAGRYQVLVNESKRFGKRMPLLINVPNYDGIRIHPGNTAADTDGCILIGLTRIKNGVGNSVAAFNDFMPRLEGALVSGPVWIEVKDAS